MSPPPILAGDDRRGEPREAVDEAVVLVAPSGQAIRARAVDRSLRGLRVRGGGAEGLQGGLTVLHPGLGAAYRAQVVWRRAPDLGLSLSQVVDLRSARGVEADELRRLWREHVGR